MSKITDLTLVADFIDPPDPPEANAELSLDATSYVVNEFASKQITILRSVRTDQVLDVDWAVTNASVTPTAGTVRFQLGESQQVVQVTALSVDTTELGSVTLANPVYVSGPVSTPVLIAPFTASFSVIDLDTPIDAVGFPRLTGHKLLCIAIHGNSLCTTS